MSEFSLLPKSTSPIDIDDDDDDDANTNTRMANSTSKNKSSSSINRPWTFPPRLKPGRKAKNPDVNDFTPTDVDMKERKRVQNREAQRAYRERQSKRIFELETNVNFLYDTLNEWKDKFDSLNENFELVKKENNSLKEQLRSAGVEPITSPTEIKYKDPLLNVIIDHFKPLEPVKLNRKLSTKNTPMSIGGSIDDGEEENIDKENINKETETETDTNEEKCVFSDVKNFQCVCKSLKVPTGIKNEQTHSNYEDKNTRSNVLTPEDNHNNGIDFNEIEITSGRSCCKAKKRKAKLENDTLKSPNTQLSVAPGGEGNSCCKKRKTEPKSDELNVASKIMTPSDTNSTVTSSTEYPSPLTNSAHTTPMSLPSISNIQLSGESSLKSTGNVLRDLDRHALN
ncbi:hypothetical protein Kpol_1023p105 [Vanderwaltozyma polyspora DSM 70294]|uniref:BZIP domain-containing protein n=1 Tax=Vanderwaltozyma polyspora (strain ATCC 22028 / DSM 70294 / BCRC 21397 / CBS 2163 / NBRC 10782 / NRRL Y-8283 / UCD 57-17) TaxID=436907 RepID=A7TFX2_VANPO|nr:uncharacterized protein Kpol_1023p105 [Vanderwaltozyma polyspora DSM 70294]EDO18930.1 hypothetical protein Kpol_1023p105 [Vanderwaltozyma polyspora DSM 70294]